ncbi:MAG TPA: endolytic transglycosylase MltG [Pseudobdellovibrionaceae bacterium]|nr:endolytic transglycosylase MltG [Pseudobdellovibrionaceae bacterium]
MKKTTQVFLLIGTVLAAFIVGTGVFLAWGFLSSPGSSATSKEVIYEATPGKSFLAIANDLQTAGVVKNARMFSIYARFTGERSKIKAGGYLFRTSMTPYEVLQVLTSGRSIGRPFTISEGLNMFEIAQAYERGGFGRAKDFLSITRDPAIAKALLGPEATSLEGYLFPETYQITKFTTTRELIASMVRRFLNVYKEVDNMGPHAMSRHQIVTFASLIEKETGAPEERPLIASVFFNRLKKNMRLQTDPTIIYGIALETGRIPNNIRRADILRPTLYNTYTISGLPPGPIANAGREALMAAIKPARSDYLFFVSRNDGTHVFSKTYEEHNRAVREYQLNPRAREGKSWRDLKSRPATGP